MIDTIRHGKSQDIPGHHRRHRRQRERRRPSHGSRKRHPPHRRDAGSTGRQWLPDPESRKQHSSGHGYSRSQERHDGEQRQLYPHL